MAEEYKLNWDIPDYGFNPQEEAPVFDFGADVDWGLTDTSNWGMLDDSWDMFQPLEEDIDWGNFDFEEEYGIPSLTWENPDTWGDYAINMEEPSWNDYGNILDEGWSDWAVDQDWSLPGPSLREMLGEEVEYGYDPYNIGSGMDQYYGDEYGDAWRSPWAQGDDPLAGFNFDAEGNITAPQFNWFPSEDASGIETLVGPEEEAATEGGRGRPVLDALAGMFGLGPAGPNAAGVTGRRRPQSPFAGGMSVTPEWLKRIGDKIGLGGRSGLQDAYVTGYPEGTGQGIFSGGDGLGSLFGGDGDGGFNLGNLVLPGILGMAAYKAAKEEDLGVPLSPSVTMDPLGRYQLARELGEATADDRGIFGLGKAPASLDFTTMGTPGAAEPYPVAPIQTPFPDNPYYEEGFPPGFTYQPVLGGE